MVKERDEQMIEAEEKEREEKKRRRREWWEKFRRRARWVLLIGLPLSLFGSGVYIYEKGWLCKYFGWGARCEPETDYVAAVEPIIKGDCRSEAPSGRAGECIEVFYATTRAFEPASEKKLYFGGDTSPIYELGTATLATPYVFPTDYKGNDDKSCIIVGRSSEEPDRDQVAKECLVNGKSARDLNFLEKEVLDPSNNQGLYDKIYHSDHADTSAYTRTVNDFAVVRELSRVVLRERRNGRVTRTLDTADTHSLLDLRDSGLFDVVQQALDARSMDKSVMIYVHGFSTTFEQSLKTAAYLAADLNTFANSNAADARNLALGVPMVFSWPTMDWMDGVADKKAQQAVAESLLKAAAASRKSPAAGGLVAGYKLTGDAIDALTVISLNYFESQLRADRDAEAFGAYIERLASATDVEEINIVGHSMGNRFIKSKLDLLAGGALRNRKGAAIRVNVVQVAPDIGRADFEAALPKEDATTSRFRSSVYVSDDDVALYLSSEIQGNKEKLIGNGQVPNNAEPQRKRIISLLNGLNVKDNWYKEDACRLGRPAANCKIRALTQPYVNVIDASDFRKKFFSDAKEFILAHGYFEYSPMVLSDISCFLRSDAVAPSGRSLKEQKGVDGNAYWVLVPKGQADKQPVNEDCASTGRLTIGLRGAPIESIEFSLFFDVEKAVPCADPLGENGPVQSGEGSVASSNPALCASDAGVAITQRLDLAAEQLAGRPEMLMKIAITGRTDCSNVGGKFDNRALALNRASSVQTQVKEFLDARAPALRYEFKESKPDTCVIESTIRDKLKRRADVTLTFRRAPAL